MFYHLTFLSSSLAFFQHDVNFSNHIKNKYNFYISLDIVKPFH